MARKKDGGDVYKHDQFIVENNLFSGAGLKGFSISNNLELVDYDVMKTNFRSDFLAVLLVTAGEATIKLNLEEYHLTKNSLLVASPYAIKQLISVNEDCLISTVSFTSDFLSKIGLPDKKIDLMDYFTSRYSPYWQLEEGDAFLLCNLLGQLEQRALHLDDHVYGQELLRHTFFLLLYELGGMSRKYAKINTPDFSRKEGLVMSFLSMAQSQSRELRNVQQYAAQLHVTPKYLTETVKEQTGKTAGELIDAFVMLEAKLLLDDHELSISQIAEQLNFSDQSFFGKFFKRHSGYSPREYRSIS
jgi:AraC family transcriptional activator of pobA